MSERRKVAWILGVLLVVAGVAGLVAANTGRSDGGAYESADREETATTLSRTDQCLEKVKAWTTVVYDNGGPTGAGLQALLVQVGSEDPFFQWFSQSILSYQGEVYRVGQDRAGTAWAQQVKADCDRGLRVPDPPQ